MENYLIHFGFGLLFAGSGAVARGWCEHLWHRVSVGVLLVALETAVIVSVAE